MTFNFDMARIGQTIARLRREHNMTQMALADAMGVSFQAVSNWERGQSMPDISKLPELAELFGTTIDALLGCHSPLIKKAAENKLDELPTPTVEEVAEAAPLLPPAQIDDLTDRLLELPNLPDMTELLRFLPTTKVDALLLQRMEAGKPLKEYALFASTNAVDATARAHEQQGLPIDDIAPFMSADCVAEIARSRTAAGRSIAGLLPFLCENSVNELARQREALGHSIDDLLPFMSENALAGIALSRLQRGQKITSLLPFLSESLITHLALAASTKD